MIINVFLCIYYFHHQENHTIHRDLKPMNILLTEGIALDWRCHVDDDIGAVECGWVIDCDCWCDTDDYVGYDCDSDDDEHHDDDDDDHHDDVWWSCMY